MIGVTKILTQWPKYSRLLALTLVSVWVSSCTLFRPPGKGGAEENVKEKKANKALINKYENLTGLHINARKSLRLYQSIDHWMGVPYRYGAMTRKGTDCAGFACNIYKEVYHVELNRSTIDQYEKDIRHIGKRRLKEGDLVFFKIEKGKKVSHVGIYLGNHKFVHASVIRGVCINDLNEKYYKDHYYRGGRVKKNRQRAT